MWFAYPAPAAQRQAVSRPSRSPEEESRWRPLAAVAVAIALAVAAVVVAVLDEDAPAEPVHALVEIGHLPAVEAAGAVAPFEPLDRLQLGAQAIGLAAGQGAGAQAELDPLLKVGLALADRDPGRGGGARPLRAVGRSGMAIACLLYTSPSPRDS